MKNVILISIDTLRYDAISCEKDKIYLQKYGLENFTDTPNIDYFAQHGVKFSQNLTTVTYTPPSHASMLTGLYPPKHGIRAFLYNKLPENIPTLYDIFRERDYKILLSIDFHDMFDLLDLTRNCHYLVRANDEELFGKIRQYKDENIFLFVHFGDVHPPYGESFCPPSENYHDDFYSEIEALGKRFGFKDEFRDKDGKVSRDKLITLSNKIRIFCEERAIADVINFPRYLNGVNKFDKGRFKNFIDNLKGIGVLDDCLMIITADHGQGPIPQRKMANPDITQKFDHGEVISEEIIRVPLILYSPGNIPAGKEIHTQTSLVDIFPTILEYSGISFNPNNIQGQSLKPAIDGKSIEDSKGYCEIWYHDRSELSGFLRKCKKAGRMLEPDYDTFLYQKCLRTPGYKYVETGSEMDIKDFDLPEREFAVALCRKLLGKVETESEINNILNRLKNNETKSELAKEYERRNYSRKALYNLKNDPYEEVNLLTKEMSLKNFSQKSDFTKIAKDLKSNMKLIESSLGKRVSISKDDDKKDMDKVADRLKALGYID
ncbi:sulfatase-like hydrolase/transferase [Candidatus Poribacteria bacterium]|nr:sulfatase-like hydrolase/transferase [Candidatus Poribacteria bacterium]